MCQRVADLWDAPVAEVTVDGGIFHHGDQEMTFKELAANSDLRNHGSTRRITGRVSGCTSWT